MKVMYFIFGGTEIIAKRYDAEKILNICMHYGLVYKNFKFAGDNFTLECSLYNAALLEKICNDLKIRINRSKEFGIPKLISNYKKRVGILAGIILICAMVFTSQMFLWDVRVSGEGMIDKDAVINELKKQDFGLGTYLPGIDVDVIENSVLINSNDISWISINLKGTVAYVEIRKKESAPQNIKNVTPANLVAARDGLIEYFEVSRGNISVKVGENVRKGDLLVSGIYDSNVWGYGYMRPQGAVYARTVRDITVEIPLKYQEKVYIGKEIEKKTLFFFSKSIKLYRNTGFLGVTYDTINKREDIYFFDGTKLPLSIESVIYRPYVYENNVHTQSDAIDIAYDKLNRIIDEFTEGGAYLLRKNVSGFFSEEYYVLECKVTLIENIAQISEIEVEK